nr:hypothetical protein [Tanacetum cinerariifolium]
MATKGNLGEVVATCERSWVQASPWGFFFRSEKGVGFIPYGEGLSLAYCPIGCHYHYMYISMYEELKKAKSEAILKIRELTRWYPRTMNLNTIYIAQNKII